MVAIELPHALEPLDEHVQRGFKTTLVVGIILLIACLTAIGAFLGFMELAFDLRWFRAPLAKLEVRGVAIDKGSADPVANARVIVSVSSRGGLKSQFACYGVEADGSGRFSFVAETPFAIRREIDVIAVAPDNRFGRVSAIAASDGDRYSTEIEVPVTEQDPAGAQSSFALHEGFSMPGCTKELKFIGKAWGAEKHAVELER